MRHRRDIPDNNTDSKGNLRMRELGVCRVESVKGGNRLEWIGMEANARNKLRAVYLLVTEDWLANPARSYTPKKTHRNPRARGTATSEKSLGRETSVRSCEGVETAEKMLAYMRRGTVVTKRRKKTHQVFGTARM
jgi:hypothetical protein